MRVLIIANIGLGLYKFRKEFLEELVKEHDVYFSIPNDEYVQPIEKIGCTFIDNPFLFRHGTNPLQDLNLFLHYKSVLKQIQPNIVFTYTIKPNVYGGLACKIMGIPYVATITGLGTAVEYPGLLQIVTVMLYKISLRKAQKVFFQNKENRDFMLNHNIINGAFEIIPGSGVNLSTYKPLAYPRSKTIDFVFIARVMKEKGIEQYLEAAKVITQKYPATRFHICGFCEQDYEPIMKKLTDNGTIIYHGLVEDMIPIYEMSSCIIHPSFYPEGLSNVLLEGAASARPIITTNRSGCKEVVEDGINGYLVVPKDTQDLIDKIERFINMDIHDRELMGFAGRIKVEKEFDRSIVIKKYLKEVESLR